MSQNRWRTYVRKFYHFDCLLTDHMVTLRSLVNTLLKAQMNHTSDREQQFGCLRSRKELQKHKQSWEQSIRIEKILETVFTLNKL